MTDCAHVWVPHASGAERCSLCGDCTHVWALDTAERVRCLCCGKLAHASPTQFEDWRACQRKWKYRRLRRRFPVPPNVWAAFGVRAHKVREDYLRAAIWTEEIARSKEGACVATGIPYWPAPGRVLGVEIEIEAVDLLGDGIPWTFKIDDMPAQPFAYDVGDLKTTGNLARRKEVVDLTEDPQRVVYSVWSAPVIRRDVVRSRWTYCDRNGKGAIPVDVEGVARDDRQRLHVINAEARAMLRANVRPLEEQDRNRNECFRYKGYPCVYAEHCLADQDPFFLAPEIETSYKDRMADVPTLDDALRARAASTTLPPMPGVVPAAPPPPPRVVLTPELETWVQQCVAAGHPEATVRAQAEAAMAPAQAAPTTTPVAVVGNVVVAQTPQPAAAPAPQPAPAPAPQPAPAPRGRGKAKNKTEATDSDRIVAAILTAGIALRVDSSPETIVTAYGQMLAALTGGE